MRQIFCQLKKNRIFKSVFEKINLATLVEGLLA